MPNFSFEPKNVSKQHWTWSISGNSNPCKDVLGECNTPWSVSWSGPSVDVASVVYTRDVFVGKSDHNIPESSFPVDKNTLNEGIEIWHIYWYTRTCIYRMYKHSICTHFLPKTMKNPELPSMRRTWVWRAGRVMFQRATAKKNNIWNRSLFFMWHMKQQRAESL